MILTSIAQQISKYCLLQNLLSVSILVINQIVKPANLTIQETNPQEDTYLSPIFMIKFGIR